MRLTIITTIPTTLRVITKCDDDGDGDDDDDDPHAGSLFLVG